jgi:hypothetical protein
VIERKTKRLDRPIDALDIEVLSSRGRSFDREQLERTHLGQDEDEARKEMASEARRMAVGLPIVVEGGLLQIVR